MSVTVGRAKLNNAYKDLLMHWEEAKDAWMDVRAKQFERDYLDPLAPQVRAALGAMERLNAVLGQCERDCS